RCGSGLLSPGKPRRAFPAGFSNHRSRTGTAHHDHPETRPADRGRSDGQLAACGDRPLAVRKRKMSKNFVCPDAFVSPLIIEDSVAAALAEDLGRAGD